MLAYNITNWGEAPGTREARVVVGRGRREVTRREAHLRAQRMARALEERDTQRVRLAIQRVVARLGYDRAEQLIEEARAVHAGAGMPVRDGSRLRTVGGIFFQLAGRA